MTHPSILDMALSMIGFVLVFVWIVAEAIYHGRRFQAFLRSLGSEKPTYVEQTINQMYGNVHVEREYAGTRNARQQLKGGH